MNAFDKVIGYENIKEELMQVCDMIHNRAAYEALGAKMPHGILLYGKPGMGKTLLASCFIEESGLPSYTLRRQKGSDDFLKEIAETFRKARGRAPSIVFLDDMDKFANEDLSRQDAEEYVAIQTGIDENRKHEVFVLATANNIKKLPESLTRSGRFDRKIKLCAPSAEDAKEIIRYYLRDKKVAKELNLEDLSGMIRYSSCAEFETILNEAAILAAYAGRESITMQDLVRAVLRIEYNAPDGRTQKEGEQLKKIALHEAGHLVVSEVLCPGSVGLATVRCAGRDASNGFVRRCRDLPHDSFDILVSLGGKAAVELYYADGIADGCHNDLSRAAEQIRFRISCCAAGGIGLLDLEGSRFPAMSESLIVQNEAAVHAELERYLLKTKEILLKNRVFLENAAAALAERETLLFSDIRALREKAVAVGAPL